jgi:HK97 gp10 family phage protein
MSNEKLKIGITGDEELKTLLNQMSSDFGDKATAKVLVSAVRESLAPALARSKALVPKDTGALAASLRIEARKPTRRDKRSVYINETDTVIATVTTAPASKLKKGVKVYDYEASYKKKKDVYKTVNAPGDARHIAMEFGTSKLSAQPYLRPGLESTAQEVISQLANKIKARILVYRSKNTKDKT